MIRTSILSLFLLASTSIFSNDNNILNYGAKGDRQTNSTKAIQKAIDEYSNTRGKVIFPAGTFAAGTVYIKSNVDIYLSKRIVWNSPKGYELEINPSQKRINISGDTQDDAEQGTVEYKFNGEYHHLVAMKRNKIAFVHISNKLIGINSLTASPQSICFLESNPNGKDCFKDILD